MLEHLTDFLLFLAGATAWGGIILGLVFLTATIQDYLAARRERRRK